MKKEEIEKQFPEKGKESKSRAYEEEGEVRSSPYFT